MRRVGLDLRHCKSARVPCSRFSHQLFTLAVYRVFCTHHALLHHSLFPLDYLHFNKNPTMRFSDLFTLLAFALPLVIASPHEHHLRQTELNKRSGADVGLRKRISNARITFYDAGL
jgi:hypothetical protein